MQIVYASERPSDLGDRVFKNPRHFLTADATAEKVFIVGAPGDWRDVEKSYQNAKIPVVRVKPGEPLESPAKSTGRQKPPATPT